MRLRAFAPFFFLLTLALVPLVYAEEEINLLNFPTFLAEKLGVSTFAGQIFATAILFMLIELPILMLSKNQLTHIIGGFLAIGLSTSMGWTPLYFLISFSLIIAISLGKKMKDVF